MVNVRRPMILLFHALLLHLSKLLSTATASSHISLLGLTQLQVVMSLASVDAVRVLIWMSCSLFSKFACSMHCGCTGILHTSSYGLILA